MTRSSKIFTVAALFFAMLVLCITPTLGADFADDGADAIAITVIVPPSPERPTTTEPQTRRVFPINVAEGYNYEGVRELVRIYELLPGERPEWINTDSFVRNGYYYQIAEIVRRVDVAHTVREHTEIVKIPSGTNDLASVIAGLSPTMDFVGEDGYAGVLHLDIRSIGTTQDGTRSTSRTVSQTREFPHLSNPDLSLIPHTVTANGRTYTLADVNWRPNTNTPIDFNSVEQTFTAFATYTRTATSTVSTGYTTFAEYSGTLTRVSTGEVRFAAIFIGTQLVTPILDRPATQTEIILCNANGNGHAEIEAPSVYVPSNGISGNGGNGEPIIILAYEPTVSEMEIVEHANGEAYNGKPLWLLFAIPALVILLTVLALMAICYKKKADTLSQQAYADSANALVSRMEQIVHQDRTELAAESEENFDYFDADTSFTLEGLENLDEDYPNEDGDENVQ